MRRAVLAASLAAASAHEPEASLAVTCGSVVKLRHAATAAVAVAHGERWGSGSSGQYAATGAGAGYCGAGGGEYWRVEGCGAPGAAVACGAAVALVHDATGRALCASRDVGAPLTLEHREVAAAVAAAEGALPAWRVACAADALWWWPRGAAVGLRHDAAAGCALGVGSVFSPKDCPSCGFSGHVELLCADRDAAEDGWVVEEGIYR